MFPGIPGRTEMLIQSVIFILPVLFLIGRRIYQDATARGSEWAWQWSVSISILILYTLLPNFGPFILAVVLIIYLLLRGKKTETI